MNNKAFRSGPIALTTTLTTNILNPPTTTGGTNAGSSSQWILVKKITVVNKTTSAATVSLWLGATGANAAGTEYEFQAFSVPANSAVERFVYTRLDAADFIVGGAGTATALSIMFEGEIGVAG
jgi:hypothetical protein